MKQDEARFPIALCYRVAHHHQVALANTQARPDQQAADLLNRTGLILVALDADKAGATESWRWWKDHYHQAHRWPPIQGKDPGEMFAAGVNLRTWVQAGLAEYAE